MKHYKLLCDFSELNWIFSNSKDIDSFLHKIVTIIVRHINADVSTIYLYDEQTEKLIFKAREGEEIKNFDQFRQKIDEKLAEKSLQTKQPVFIKDVDKETGYSLWVSDIKNTKYKSFLSVPINRGISNIGVLNLYREKNDCFTEQDVNTLKVLSSQLANIIENAKFIINLEQKRTKPVQHKPYALQNSMHIKGLIASEGLAIGGAKVLNKDRSLNLLLNKEFEGKFTIKDFYNALNKTETQLNKMQREIEATLDDAASLIFTSHLLMLKDPVLLEDVENLVESGVSVPKALLKVAAKYIELLNQNTNPYIREKVQDVEDLVLRILDNLFDKKLDLTVYEKKIIIAHQLYPSDLLKMSTEKVAGIIQVRGGVTSHVSILARSLRIPFVIADLPELMSLPPDKTIILDADHGDVYINPDKEIIEKFKTENRLSHSQPRVNINKINSETFTKDGMRIQLMTNVNLLSDLRLAMECNAEGVGLYRTEFPFLLRNNFPSEEEQYVIYKKIIDVARGKRVVFRTLDIGGDKIHAYYRDYHEVNPYLGMRSIRFSLHNKDIFKQQIRAMLRACAHLKPYIMFPMVSSLDEFLKAKEILLECRAELLNEKIALKEEPKIGMMIELPSLVEIMEELAREADFFSIGTNDFVQYMLAVDRTNEKVAHMYIPHHPAILRALKKIVAIANTYKKEISVCGEMAHHHKYIPFLIGIGLRCFSMDAMYLHNTQQIISQLTISQTVELAQTLLTESSVTKLATLLDIEG